MYEIVYSYESKPDMARMNPTLNSSNIASQSLAQPWVCTMVKDTFKETHCTITEAGASVFESILGQAIFSLEMGGKKHAYQHETYSIAGGGQEIGLFQYEWEQKYILDTNKYPGCVSVTHFQPAISGTFFPLIDTFQVDGVKLISQNCEESGVGDIFRTDGIPFVFNLVKHGEVSEPELGPKPRPKPPPRPPPEAPRPGP